MGVGVFIFLLVLMGIPAGISLPIIIGLLFSFGLISISLYRLYSRLQGKGLYWDENGVVVDLKGKKVNWNEIEKIEFYTSKGAKSTVIIPHTLKQDIIQKRHKRIIPPKGFAIDWFGVEKPNDFHKNLVKAWEEKRNL
jgi:hypothetical protein